MKLLAALKTTLCFTVAPIVAALCALAFCLILLLSNWFEFADGWLRHHPRRNARRL